MVDPATNSEALIEKVKARMSVYTSLFDLFLFGAYVCVCVCVWVCVCVRACGCVFRLTFVLTFEVTDDVELLSCVAFDSALLF